MTTAALSAPTPVQMEPANFLNLLIVDDERAIREVCREVAQSLGFNTAVADSADMPTVCWTRRTSMWCCST